MNNKNMPNIKIGVVAVSRDCFPESLSVNRRKALIDAYTAKYGEEHIYECPICIVESEIHMVQALEDVKAAGCNALAVYLGNFGPEIAETLLAKHFDGPKMFVAAAEELKSPVIMQTTPSTIKYASPEMFYANVAAAANNASVPVVMHLDHGSSFELAVHAFRAGYTSIMIDGSHSVFEENIAITKSVVDVCHAGNVPVEAELGKVGGKEDDLDGGNGGGYTVPSEAVEFVEKTGIE